MIMEETRIKRKEETKRKKEKRKAGRKEGNN